MLNEYKLNGPTRKIEVEVEKEVAENLIKMEAYSHLSISEIADTALKRFIAVHKDFMPPKTDSPLSG